MTRIIALFLSRVLQTSTGLWKRLVSASFPYILLAIFTRERHSNPILEVKLGVSLNAFD